MAGIYGIEPVSLDAYWLGDWTEFMHYQYLPVRMPGTSLRIPERLAFLRKLLGDVVEDAAAVGKDDPYVYVTVRRGFATPDNPLNRPGWHCDGFGTDDINYVWWDRWGTRFAVQDF